MAGNPNIREIGKTTRFKPGDTGNPKGRPKEIVDLRSLARQHTEKAIAALVEVVTDADHAQRVAAAKELLDRGYGKALQTQDVTIRQLEIADALQPYLAPDKKDELARLLGALRANAASN